MAGPDAPDTPPTRSQLARVATASCVGTTIEWYDFYIYGTAAALVFPTVFFPALGSAAGTVASLATLGVAFVARPLGAMICGHFGDRYGRKTTLIVTLLVMGIATVLIGLLPGAETIGVAAPILLVVLRFAQGIAVGGEWAGANVLSAEYAPPGKRGFYAIFPQLGPALAFMLSSATFLLVDVVIGPDSPAFMAYGWRIPFLASALLVLLGLWVRVAVEETPEFRRRAAADRAAGVAPASFPLRAVLGRHGRLVALGGGAVTSLFALFYVATAYMTSYGTSATGAGLDRTTVLSLGVLAGAVLAVAIALGGPWSDRFGRRRSMVVAFAVTIPAAPLAYLWLGSATGAAAFGVVLCVTLVLFGVPYGPVGAYLTEIFRGEHRYTGAGLAYSLGGILGGAAVPPLAVALASAYGVGVVGLLLGLVAAASLGCLLLLPEPAPGRGAPARTADESDEVPA